MGCISDLSGLGCRRLTVRLWPAGMSAAFNIRFRFRIQIQIPLQIHFAPRCALAGELLFSVAKKVTKNALYRRQLLPVLIKEYRG